MVAKKVTVRVGPEGEQVRSGCFHHGDSVLQRLEFLDEQTRTTMCPGCVADELRAEKTELADPKRTEALLEELPEVVYVDHPGVDWQLGSLAYRAEHRALEAVLAAHNERGAERADATLAGIEAIARLGGERLARLRASLAPVLADDERPASTSTSRKAARDRAS